MLLGWANGPLCLAASRGTAIAPQSRSESGLPSEPNLLKRAILSNAVLYAEVPAVRKAQAYQSHSLDVYNLLAQFDRLDSTASIEVLISFNSYYFGAAFGEMDECIVLRKGRPILPYLARQLASNRNECAGTLGKAHPRLCLSESEYRARVNMLIKYVRSGSGCSDEEMANTFGF
jgi:hypothetical protein